MTSLNFLWSRLNGVEQLGAGQTITRSRQTDKSASISLKIKDVKPGLSILPDNSYTLYRGAGGWRLCLRKYVAVK